jgi:hypothetical protein
VVMTAKTFAGAACVLATLGFGEAFALSPSTLPGPGLRGPRVLAGAATPRAKARTARQLGPVMQESNFFSKFARLVQEKAKADIDRTKRLFSGLEGVTSNMGVIDELITFWNLDEVCTHMRVPACEPDSLNPKP